MFEKFSRNKGLNPIRKEVLNTQQLETKKQEFVHT